MKSFITLLLVLVMFILGGISLTLRTIITIILLPVFILIGAIMFFDIMSKHMNEQKLNYPMYMEMAHNNQLIKIEKTIAQWLHTLDRDILHLAVILSEIVLRRTKNEKSN